MIQLNDFTRQWAEIGPVAMAAVERVGSSGCYILGDEVRAFESTLAKFWGLAHAVGVGNGMDAIEIGLRCLGLRAGEKVLTTPLSAFATTLAIIRVGGVPVFADVDATGTIDLAQCRDILQRDRHIRFFVPVHLFGRPIDLSELKRLKEDFDLSVVEDCAQAIGATDRGVRVGTVGQIAATSFYPTKNLGALGDGGALLTDDAELEERAKTLRNYGQSAHYVHDELGLNSRLDEIHAGVLRDALLPNLQRWTGLRRHTAAAYMEGITKPWITTPSPVSGCNPVWHLFPIIVPPETRESFRDHLRSKGITTAVHYPRIIPDQVALQKTGGERPELTNARRFATSEVSLPIHPFLTDPEIRKIIGACNNWRPSKSPN